MGGSTLRLAATARALDRNLLAVVKPFLLSEVTRSLTDFYARHNPSKTADDIQRTVQHFVGASPFGYWRGLVHLNQQLRRKYGAMLDLAPLAAAAQALDRNREGILRRGPRAFVHGVCRVIGLAGGCVLLLGTLVDSFPLVLAGGVVFCVFTPE